MVRAVRRHLDRRRSTTHGRPQRFPRLSIPPATLTRQRLRGQRILQVRPFPLRPLPPVGSHPRTSPAQNHQHDREPRRRALTRVVRQVLDPVVSVHRGARVHRRVPDAVHPRKVGVYVRHSPRVQRAFTRSVAHPPAVPVQVTRALHLTVPREPRVHRGFAFDDFREGGESLSVEPLRVVREVYEELRGPVRGHA